MMRNFLATTAIAAVIATGAYAQDASQTNTQMSTPQAGSSDAMNQNMGSQAQGMQGDYLQSLSQDQYLASNLNGKSVYPSNDENAEAIGDIQNFLVDSDGTVAAAIVNVTGGDQNKLVAVPFDQISWTMDQDNEPRAVMQTGADQLAQAPAFTTPEEQQSAAANSSANAPATGAAGTTGMAGTGTATTAPATGAPATGTAGTGMAANDTAAGTATAPAQPMGQGNDMAANSGSTMSGEYATSRGADQYLSENLIGTNVYGGPGQDADDIGEISDLVMASSGKVAGAVVGVGGFLGIGQKDVGVPFEKLEFTRDQDQQPRVVFAANREALEQAPSFNDERPGDAAANQNMAATDTGAANGTMAPQTDQTAQNTAPAGAATTAAPAAGAATGTAMGTAAGTAPGAADTTATASTGGDMRSQLQPVGDSQQLTADRLMGTTVYGPNDQTVGDIGDVALTKDGQVDAVIIDVGGFLGIGEKPVAVAMDNLQFMQDNNGSLYLYTTFTEDQLNNAPEYNADTYAQNRDTMRLENQSDVGAQNNGTSQ